MQRGHCRSFAAVLLCGGDARRRGSAAAAPSRTAAAAPPAAGTPAAPGVDVHRVARRRVELVAGVHRVRRVDVRARGPLEGLPRRLRLRLPELVDAVLAHAPLQVRVPLGPHVVRVVVRRLPPLPVDAARAAAPVRGRLAHLLRALHELGVLAVAQEQQAVALAPGVLGPGPPRPQHAREPVARPPLLRRRDHDRAGVGLLRPPALAAQRARPLDGVALRDGERRAVRLAGLLGGALLVDGAGRAVDRLG